MLQNHHLRTPALHRAALVCAVALTLVVSRSSAISVPKASLSHRTTVHCQSTYPKRQILNQNGGLDFSLTSQTGFISPPLASSLGPSSSDDPLLPFRPGNFHHNRPPPLS